MMGEHAVVLGASMAGMMAAKVLSGSYRRVTIVDRDALPSTSEARKGVPQGRQVHVILAGGARALEGMFPGLLAEMVADGTPVIRDMAELRISVGGHLFCHGDRPWPIEVYQPSRPHLERHVRERLRTTPGIAVIEQSEVVGLVFDADEGRVSGARIVRHGGGHREETLGADVVVDATGRGGRATTWLAAMGYEPPVEEEVVVQLRYVTQQLRLAPGALGRRKFMIIGPVAGRPSGLALIENEHDRWALALFGYGGHHPPTDPAGRQAFVDALAPPDVAAAIRDAVPLGEATSYRIPSNLRRRYEDVRRFPAGLVVIGDAVCSFNPLYGQGMSVAAMQALALRDTLAHGDHELSRRFFRAAAKPIDVAWQLAVGGDLALPEVEGHRPTSLRLTNAYVDRLLVAAEHDPVVVERFSRVTNFLDPVGKLLSPRLVWRIVAGSSGRRFPERTRS